MKNKDVCMNPFQFQTVPNIIAGLGSIQELKNVLTQQNYHKVLIVTDAGMIQHQLHQPILKILEEINLNSIIYSDIQADPPEHIVLEAVDFAKQEKIDVIIGFGGGSSMDVAKIIALLAHPEQQQNLSEIYGVTKPKHLACHSFLSQPQLEQARKLRLYRLSPQVQPPKWEWSRQSYMLMLPF